MSTKPNSKFYVSLRFHPSQQRYQLHHNQRLYKDARTALQNSRQGLLTEPIEGLVLEVDLDACKRWTPDGAEPLHEQYAYAEHMMLTWAERCDEIRQRMAAESHAEMAVSP